MPKTYWDTERNMWCLETDTHATAEPTTDTSDFLAGLTDKDTTK